MNLLIVEYLHDHGVYLAIPCKNGKPDPDHEFLFSSYLEAKEFIDAYFENQLAAIFAYRLREEMLA